MHKYKTILTAITFATLIYINPSFGVDITKVSGWHHSVTEIGTIQVRQVTKYLKDGKVNDEKFGKPMKPADPKDMAGWDDRTKDIVAAITDPATIAAFEAEKQTKTGIGIEEIVTYDRVIEEDGKIAVRKIIRIFDDGVEVSKKYHRSWIMPGDDPSKADVMSKAVAQKIHTQAVIDVYKAYKAAQAALAVPK